MSSSLENSVDSLATGYRDCLTPAQSRTLLQLWSRFFAACTVPPRPSAVAEEEEQEHDGAGDAEAGGKQRVASASGAGRSFASTRERLARKSQQQQQQQGKRHASGVGSDSASPSTSSFSASVPDLTRAGAKNELVPPASATGGEEILASGAHIPRDDAAKDTLRLIEEAKEMRIFLDRYGGARLREVFWRGLVKGEHPDAVMLRFLRSRKWDVDRALNVIGSTARFRIENNVDALMKGGELELVQTRGGYNILNNGISYVYGATATGEPVYVIEVGSHYSSNQTQSELQRGVIYLQEWLSLLMPPPVERKVVIFNLSKFSLRNMDWWCVFFMVKTVERFYPESLSRVYVHCPPWIFRPIWFILKPLLDPVVRDKVRLTSSTDELADLIPYDHLPKDSLAGGADWAYSWPPAEEGENDVQLDTQTAAQKMDAFFDAAAKFEKATREYIRLFVQACSPVQRQAFGSMPSAPSAATVASTRLRNFAAAQRTASGATHDTSATAAGGAGAGGYGFVSGSGGDRSRDLTDDEDGDFVEPEGAQEMRGRRDVLATRLRVAFLEMRPYFIGISKYDRWGVMRPDGTVRWEYKKLDGSTEVQILGENTSLPVLKRGLQVIEQAERAARKEQEQRAAEAAASAAAAAAAAGEDEREKGPTRRHYSKQRSAGSAGGAGYSARRRAAAERPPTGATAASQQSTLRDAQASAAGSGADGAAAETPAPAAAEQDAHAQAPPLSPLHKPTEDIPAYPSPSLSASLAAAAAGSPLDSSGSPSLPPNGAGATATAAQAPPTSTSRIVRDETSRKNGRGDVLSKGAGAAGPGPGPGADDGDEKEEIV